MAARCSPALVAEAKPTCAKHLRIPPLRFAPSKETEVEQLTRSTRTVRHFTKERGDGERVKFRRTEGAARLRRRSRRRDDGRNVLLNLDETVTKEE